MEKEIEIWKSLDFMGYPSYEISTFGRVKSLERKGNYKDRILKQSKNRDGYFIVKLCENGKVKNFRVHRLVALAFLKNPENLPCVNHKNEIKTDNHVSNLEWVSQKENANYGTRNDRMGKAKRKPIQQYTLDGVFVKVWDSATSASTELNISRGNITSCCKGERNKCGGYIWRFK